MADPPRKQIDDVPTLRALAHPARVALIEVLAMHGSLTATGAGELIGESPSNCSFHLRQLARYGLIEQAESTDGRTRPWQVVPGGIGIGIGTGSAQDAEFTATAAAVNDLWTARQAAAEAEWLRRWPAEPAEWQAAAMSTFTYRWLTADELAAYQRDAHALIDRYRGRRGLDSAPPGARPVRVYASAFPAGPAHPAGPGPGPDTGPDTDTDTDTDTGGI